MSAEITPMDRARDAVNRLPGATWLNSTQAACVALTAALDDPDLGGLIRDWRAPCEHSRPLRYGPDLSRSAGEREQACSPCLRDRLVAYLLAGAR
jgi:hypothetical protein